MAEWNKNKVESSAINGGKEFTTDDVLTVKELNALVNNSLYGVEVAELNTFSIGTVTSGDVASATITGVAPNKKLNLVLPKGEKGDKGDTGSVSGLDVLKTENVPYGNLYSFLTENFNNIVKIEANWGENFIVNITQCSFESGFPTSNKSETIYQSEKYFFNPNYKKDSSFWFSGVNSNYSTRLGVASSTIAFEIYGISSTSSKVVVSHGGVSSVPKSSSFNVTYEVLQ